MWVLVAGAGAVVVWLVARGRTTPLGTGHREMSETEKDALNRVALNQGQRGGLGGTGNL